MSATFSSTKGNTSASTDPMMLLEHLEVGAAVLDLMLTIRRIDREIGERKSHDRKHTPGMTPLRRNQSVLLDNGPKMVDDEKFMQSLGRRLFDALEALDASPDGRSLVPEVGALYADGNITVLLAWSIVEKAAVDDHIAAAAMEAGEDLPPMTRCQTLVQTSDFSAFLRDGDLDLGTLDRCESVVWALVKQCDVDLNRESFAWRNGGSILDKTNCQVLFEHQYFKILFEGVKNSYYQIPRQVPVFDWQAQWWGTEESTGNTDLARIECTGCCDTIPPLNCLQASCDHYFCEGCVVTLAGICVKDESSFPMKCCKQPIKASDVIPFLDQNLRMLYEAACLEFGTPAADRVYCPQPKCSAFLGSAASSGSRRKEVVASLTCQDCGIAVCMGCREKAHPGDNCKENEEMKATRKLAEEQNWKTCPKCRAIVEKTEGCNHMVCRCTQEFCYKCGVLWRPRTCNC